MEEGWDSPAMKNRYDDYSPEKFRKLPKVFGHGMSDYEGTRLIDPEMEDDDFDNFEDFKDDDDFEPIFEDNFSDEVDDEILPEFTEKLNESLDMFRRFKKYN
jgi:hypothetical protein